MSGKVSVRTFWKKNTLPALVKRLELEQSNAAVTIGIHEDDGSREKTSKDDSPARLLLIDVATFHEFGTKNIPQRSFIRGNDHNNNRTYRAIIEELKDKIIFGTMKPAQALGLLGEKIRADIQSGIRKGLKPALEEGTVKSKGSSIPLVDTGQLINGITYQVKGAK